MNILLTGASGFIGHHILHALEQHNHKVTAWCRHPEKLIYTSDSTQVLKLNYTELHNTRDWSPILQNIEVVINCVGIIVESKGQSFQTLHAQVPITLFKAAEQAGVKKIIQISALGADRTAQSAYHLSKKTADDALRNIAVDWTILQPSIVYGDGAQSMALFHALAALPVHALIDGGKQLIRPIHVNDVCTTILQCLKEDSPTHLTLPLVGPDTISYKCLLAQLRRRLGKKPVPTLSISGELAQHSVFIGKWLGEPTFNAENIAMLRQGNTADAKPLEQFLGHPTKSLENKLLSTPANQAERWHASLYFLRPLLRLSIAFLWIWSGIVSIFFFPVEQSYQFLAASGITGNAAPIMLYGLAMMDILLGIATLAMYRIRWLILFQLTIIILYTISITFTLPDFWLHPFGPIAKNIPLLTTLLVYLTLEGEKP